MSIGQVNEGELEQRLGLVEMARSWSPRVIAKLENVIRSHQDDDLYRFNPVRYAIQTGMAESEAIALFLHATRSGLFTIEWHLVCASCGHLVESLRSMGNLHSHYDCDMCFAENEATLDDFIHVTFTVSSEIRRLAFHEPDTLPIEDFYFKYRMAKGIRPLPLPGEPTFQMAKGTRPLPSPAEPTFNDVVLSWTKLLTYLKPGERQAIEVDAPIGSFYRISDLLNNTVCVVMLGPELSEQIQHVQVALIGHKLRIVDKDVLPTKLETPTFHYNVEQVCTLPGGKIVFELENRTSERSSVWIILVPQDVHPPRLEFETFLSGKRLLTDPTFRELFGDEALDESQNIGIKNITFLVSDLKGSTALYDAVGDVQGYHLVRRHFAALTRAVAGHSGAVVKTIGDEVMATFADPVDAVSAAIDISREVEEMNRTLSERLCLKMGIHGGHCLLVTLNNRLDYFGQTVNIAYRLLRLARGGELCLSNDICENPQVIDLMDSFGVPTERVDTDESDAKAMAYMLQR
jgi:class 3 adenylate cyclase